MRLRVQGILDSRRIGLAPRLVVLAVLLTSMVGTAVAASTIEQARSALRDQILSTHLAVADLVAAEVTDYVSDVQQDAHDLVDSGALTAALARADFDTAQSQLERWTTQSRRRVETANLYSPDGVWLATSLPDKTRLGSVVAQSDLREVIASGHASVMAPVRARSTGRALLPYMVPLRGPSGEIAAVLSVGISLQALSDRLLALPLGRSTRIALTDNASGLLLVHPDPQRVVQTESTGRNEASRRARAGERGALENVSSRGERTLAAFSPIPAFNWGVLVQAPADEAFAPVEAMTLSATLWVVAAVLVAALFAAVLAVSLVRPLRTLRSTAERMAGGDFARRTGVVGGSEIGDLGRAFDRMAEQLQDSIHELVRQARHDPVTGLGTRVVLRERLERATLLDERLALLVMDLDRFKDVNDTLGHPAGDALLEQVGLRLRAALRESDTVARLGGDEFAMVLPGATQAEAAAIAQRLVHVVEAPFTLLGHPVTIGASVGVAARPEHGSDADTLLRCADVAMYVAKRANQGVARYAPDQDEHTPDRLALVGELREALASEQLTLAFQPQLECRRGTVAGVEALVRWPHPRHGLVPPDRFVPLAEQNGLITELSRWVLKAALRQHRAWRAAGIDVPVSVNLSMHDLLDPGLADAVAAILADLQVGPEALRLEITESSLMSDPGRALETLRRLCGMGVSVSIDDFGTGYSSLAYLKNLPVDELKIDRSFVRDMAADDSDLVIVRSTIELAHNLGLRVVAEGVEDEATLALLRSFGCDEAQGYFFSRPLSPADATDWLVSQLVAASQLRAA